VAPDPPDGFLLTFGAAVFFAAAFLEADFLAADFLAADFLAVDFFALVFLKVAVSVGFAWAFGGAGGAGAPGSGEALGCEAGVPCRRRHPNHAAAPMAAAIINHTIRRTRRR
jgi:hypothetical protein